MEDILLLGLGGHAHSVVDSIERSGKYNIIGFLDTEEMVGKHFKDYCVLGTDETMNKYYTEGVKNAFVTIGFLGHGSIRNRLYEQLKNTGFTLPSIIDSTALVSDNAELAEGIFIGKNVVLNSNTVVEKMCIVNTGAIVEHNCTVGEFSHIAVGSILCGGVSIGSQTLIGANAVVIQGRRIGNYCIIGAGTTIRKDVEDYKVVYGNGAMNYIEDKLQ